MAAMGSGSWHPHENKRFEVQEKGEPMAKTRSVRQPKGWDRRDWALRMIRLFVSGAAVMSLSACALQSASHSGMKSLTTESSRPKSHKIELTPSSRVLYAVLVGRLAVQRGDYPLALREYRQALALAPSPQLAQSVIEAASFLHDDKAMLMAARRWERLQPDDPDARRAMAVIAARMGRVTPAVRGFAAFVRLHGKNQGRALLRVAELLKQDVRPVIALGILQKVVREFSQQPVGDFAVGILALQFKHYAQALHWSQQTLARDPGFRRAYILEAEARAGLQDTVAALKTLRQALVRFPDDPDLQLAYGQMLLQTRDYNAARHEFRRLARRFPNNANVLYTLARVDFELDQDIAARQYFLRVLKLGAQHLLATEYFLGRLAERSGDMRSALLHYAEVTGGRYAFEAQIRIAYILAAQGALGQARDFLQQLRTSVHEPVRKINLYLVEVQLLNQADSPRQALTLLGRALKQFPGNPRLLYARGMLETDLGRLQAAEADWRTIIQRNPNNAEALNALGYTLVIHTWRYREALDYIKRALALRPDDPAILDSMGWVQYRLGRYARAVQSLQKSYHQLKNPEVAAHLVQALYANGQRAAARALLDSALHINPDNVTLQNLRKHLFP